VELMGGRIGAVSEPGVGSTFHFTANLEVAPAPGAAGRARLPEGLRVLVVDDSGMNRAILAAYLGSRELRCELAGSGREALAALREAVREGDPMELVVLDFHMPEMNGLELATAIRGDASLRGTRLVMLTSTGDNRSAAREAGIEHYLTKPVRRARLLEAVAEAMGTETAAVPEARAAAVSTGLRVLVAEDNAVNQLVIQGMLAQRGIEVACAADGEEALAMLAERAYAAVFMDCQMPRLDGYAATARIRAGEGDGPRIPIVAMTAHAMTGDRERCLAAGMDDYLTKPIRPDVLDAMLERWLGLAPASREDAPAAAASEALIDAARMHMFRDEYADIAGQLLDLFARSTPPLLDELRAAMERDDADAVRAAAHKLKGSCQNIGASFMATLCRSLEAGEGEPGETLDGLDEAFPPTHDALLQALAG
jgi:CheY-like chemotaxis protein